MFQSVPEHSNVSETFQKCFENIMLCFQNVPKLLIWPALAKFIVRHVAMEEEKENAEKLNGPSRFTETKLEKGVACVTCNRRRYTNEEKLNVLMGLHRPRKQNKRKRVACVSFRPSATRWRELHVGTSSSRDK